MISSESDARAFVAGMCDEEAMDRLDRLAQALPVENQLQNLVAKPTLSKIWQRHIADSAQLLGLCDTPSASQPWLDLGSGAGFPGLVIAAMKPDMLVVLVEAPAVVMQFVPVEMEHLAKETTAVLDSEPPTTLVVVEVAPVQLAPMLVSMEAMVVLVQLPMTHGELQLALATVLAALDITLVEAVAADMTM